MTLNLLNTTAEPFFFFNDTATTEIYTLSLHDALPIWAADDLEIAAKEAGAWNVNDTTIGGILRASASHWVTGLIDDVALWKRALSEAEIAKLKSEGLVSVFPPLANGLVAHWPLDEVQGN